MSGQWIWERLEYLSRRVAEPTNEEIILINVAFIVLSMMKILIGLNVILATLDKTTYKYKCTYKKLYKI